MAREKGGPHYVWGICTNLDTDGNGNPCPNCKSKEKLKLSIRDEFVCPECGEPLTKVKGTIGPNWKKIGIITGAVLGVAAIIVGILFGTGIIGGQKVPPTITLSESNITLKVGERTQLKASMEPEGKNATFTFKSSDPKSVEVTSGGVITALKKVKNATITVKLGDSPNVTAYCKVTVTDGGAPPPPTLVETLSINEPSTTLKVGEKKAFTYNALPQDHAENITWTSSDESVAKVNTQTGEVTAVKAGTATITVQTDTSGKSANVVVTVKKEPGPGPIEIDLGYGIYNGSTNSAGQPHGSGTIRYYTPHKIVESKDYVAQRGESVTGTFRDGKLQTGQWYKNDGTQQRVNR